MTMMRSMKLAPLALLALLAASPAAALAPIDAVLFAFPGAVQAPPDAIDAGTALGTLWLGDRPMANPAFVATRGVELSPALVRMSRQDLRAPNRNFDEQSAFIDAAGGWIGTRLGNAMLFAYASQPVLRLEDNAFTRGRIADPANPPATIQAQSTTRELRAGAGLSWGRGSWRVGAAGEWTVRSDEYVVKESGGSPTQGTRTTSFDGSALGVSLGGRFASAGETPRLEVGIGGRWLPPLDLSGDDTFEGLAGDSVTSIAITRGSGWEGGLSARVLAGRGFHLVGQVTAHGEREWEGIGLKTGDGGSWSLGGEVRDPEGPWTFRFGFGQEEQHGVPEPRAGLIGLGFGWGFEGTRIELGVTHRTISRDNLPNFYDDRVIGTVGVDF
jgi:hypothetical protein